MKFVMDERVKHRLTGLVVILAIAAIFLPAMLKKSNQHFEENMNLSIRLPVKPIPPKVVITDKVALFQAVKVAHVDVSTKIAPPRELQIAKAEPLSIKSVVPPAPIVAKNPIAIKAPVVTKTPIVIKDPLVRAPVMKAAAATQKLVHSVALKKQMYAVQLASFVQQENAKSLVTRLRSKGYVASYNKFRGKQGEFYQVLVGQLNQKDEATTLQKKLAASLQLNGFVVIKKGVS